MMMISSKREQVPVIYWIDSAKDVMRFLLADCSQLIATDKVIHDDDDDGD
jgi:hypothetical protein